MKIKNILKDIFFIFIIFLFIVAIIIAATKSYNEKIIRIIEIEREINNSFVEYNNNLFSHGKYIIIKPVKSSMICKGYYSKIDTKNISFFMLKQKCLEQAPEANELANIDIKYSYRTICGVTKVVAEMYAIAIKINKEVDNGKNENEF